MSARSIQIALSVLAVLMMAAGVWWWYDTFEKRWEATANTSTAARENTMLAATQLLTQHQHKVDTETTLSEALIKPLPDGVLMLTESGGVITPEQAKQLLAWVAKGNTLIMRPKWASGASGDDDDDEEVNVDDEDNAGDEQKTDEQKKVADEATVAADADDAEVAADAPAEPDDAADTVKVEADPIGAHVGTVLGPEAPRKQHQCPAPDAPKTSSDEKAAPKKPQVRVANITLPNAAYALKVQANQVSLNATKTGKTPLFADDAGIAVRVYAEGKGHIVMMANNNFENRRLNLYDHAELLLGLAQLRVNANGAKNHILFVQRLDVLTWYQALWSHFQFAIISIACGLLLLFWVAIQRFGPMLPEPNRERRSLIEHIDASGRWLWKVPGGRDILLNAALIATDKILQRRVPELSRLSPAEQSKYLADACKLARANIAEALHQPAAKSPIEFTRQIQTLQQLRKYYER